MTNRNQTRAPSEHEPERRSAFATFVGVMRDYSLGDSLLVRLPLLQDAGAAARAG